MFKINNCFQTVSLPTPETLIPDFLAILRGGTKAPGFFATVIRRGIALRRLRTEVFVFEASLCYIAKACLKRKGEEKVKRRKKERRGVKKEGKGKGE